MLERIMFIDTETGGIDADTHSLLSIGIAIWEKTDVIFKTHYYVKHPAYNVTNNALKINKIDISLIDSTGLTPKTIISNLHDIKKDFFNNNAITLAGHNVQFDINFLKKMFKDCLESYQDVFSHRVIDTSSILKYLYYANIITGDYSSSDDAFQYFKIIIDQRHSALDDCIATAQLFNELIKTIKDKQI